MVSGVINNFRIGRKTKSPNQMIVIVDGVESKDGATKLVGKKVVYTTESGKKMTGAIASPHGIKGSVRVIFETGMPGQAIGKKVDVQ